MALFRFATTFAPRRAASILIQQLNGPARTMRPFYGAIVCVLLAKFWLQSHLSTPNKAFADAKDAAGAADSEDVEPQVDESDSNDADGAEAEAADGTEEDAPKSPEETIEEVRAVIRVNCNMCFTSHGLECHRPA